MCHKYRGEKSRGKHTTYLDNSWTKHFLKAVQKEPSVEGIRAGIIVPVSGRTRSNYSAKRIAVGIELTIFQGSMKQQVLIYTKDADLTANNLGLTIKR